MLRHSKRHQGDAIRAQQNSAAVADGHKRESLELHQSSGQAYSGKTLGTTLDCKRVAQGVEAA